MALKILLVDDHTILRTGLRALLSMESGVQIIAEAANGLAAIQAVEKHKPDVVLLDLAIPGLNGLEVTYQISQRFPETRVVILSMYAKEAYVVEAFRNGALGYVLKGSEPKELLQAIQCASQGKRYLGSPLSEDDLNKYMQDTKGEILDPFDKLTIRERQIFQLTAEGMSSTEIGNKLFISYRTVEVHRAKLMKKLGINNQAELIRYALQRGLAPIDNIKIEPNSGIDKENT
jgi:DNA-binding NarL/FixJ family response regulator